MEPLLRKRTTTLYDAPSTAKDLILLPVILACSKLLDVNPQGQPTTAQFFQNATDASYAVASCYAKLRE
ncbi:MAG: hypothetical protein EOO38_24265, partial [Cytophagaceae bacterium]